MTIYSYQNTVFLFLVTAVFLAGACSSGEKQQAAQSDGMAMSDDEHAAHADMQMDAGEPTGESIYNVSSTWQNRRGESVTLNSLGGKVQVVAMVYTHCEHACPRILADMQRIRDGLPEKALSATNFTIISIDPERDTPGRLTDFARENNLSDDQWTLLNGDEGDILEIAALLGVKYKRISDTDFTHSNMITVLNKEGEVAYQRRQLTDQQDKIIDVIHDLGS
ncbi:protein SCO1/2 [Fodinibius roseus]|uniref:Protein SCO1/2 n=1 Tax=Fodinibius roseus TaxID=1194090 RepID=A0A1M5ELP4_9BACT|nr:SCO family protein [Fodinibius roseus]SHF80064.1 protein SCO1/2 [Fodinibius roseus]